MSDNQKQSQAAKTTRRNFIKSSSILAAGGAMIGASTLSLARAAHPFGSDTVKIGLVGCGGRGTGAADQAMNTKGPTQLVAMADAFSDRLTQSLRGLASKHKDKIDVPKDRQFVGFDAFKHVLETDADLIILATPPGFRPQHFEAAVAANKHVFMEKPVAVDAPGVKRVLAAGEEAKKKDLLVQVGLQRRHEDAYRETIKRLQEGAIGDIIFSRAYWNGSGVWVRPRQEGQTEMEYQMRNWYYFNWLCGDHITEQHIHNLDVINWLKGGAPVEANGMGGRQVRTGSQHGQIYDHHMVEFTYADGTKMLSQCRHIHNCWNSVTEHCHGATGTADISGAKIYDAKGDIMWQFGRGGGGGHQEEHHHLFADLREGKRPNEAEYGAMSTMTSILGRMCTYSGERITMKDALERGALIAPTDKFTGYDDTPPVVPGPDGEYPVPQPGSYKPLV